MTRSNLALSAVLALVLSGCGFHPLYSNRSAAGPARSMQAVHVGIIPDRPGQLLRQALQRRLEGTDSSVAKQYELSVAFGEAADAIAIQADNTSSRVRITGSATWTLKSASGAQQTLATGTVRALDGLNVIDQQYFAVDLEGEEIQRRLTGNLADMITQQIAAYFDKQARTG